MKNMYDSSMFPFPIEEQKAFNDHVVEACDGMMKFIEEGKINIQDFHLVDVGDDDRPNECIMFMRFKFIKDS